MPRTSAFLQMILSIKWSVLLYATCDQVCHYNFLKTWMNVLYSQCEFIVRFSRLKCLFAFEQRWQSSYFNTSVSGALLLSLKSIHFLYNPISSHATLRMEMISSLKTARLHLPSCQTTKRCTFIIAATSLRRILHGLERLAIMLPIEWLREWGICAVYKFPRPNPYCQWPRVRTASSITFPLARPPAWAIKHHHPSRDSQYCSPTHVHMHPI